jgi:hypothetical protein
MAHIVDLVYQSFLCEYQKILLDYSGINRYDALHRGHDIASPELGMSAWPG